MAKWTDNGNQVMLEDDLNKLDVAIIGDFHAGILFIGMATQWGIFVVKWQNILTTCVLWIFLTLLAMKSHVIQKKTENFFFLIPFI